MHRHDLDLIAAYASGDPDDDTLARDLVTNCEICRDEYQLQLSVLSKLADLDQPVMTGEEKADLHRDLWTDLRTTNRSVPGPSRVPLWYRWSAAAAGLLLVVGLMAVLANRATDTGLEATGNELAANESTSGDGSGQAEIESDGRLDDGTVGSTVAGAIEEPSAPEGVPHGASGEDEAIYLAMIDRVRESPPADVSNYSSEAAEAEAATCLEKAGLEDQTTVGRVDEETPYLLAILVDEPFAADSPITVVDAATCEVIHVDIPPE